MEKRTKFHNETIKLKEMITLFKEKGILSNELQILFNRQQELLKEKNKSSYE